MVNRECYYHPNRFQIITFSRSHPNSRANQILPFPFKQLPCRYWHCCGFLPPSKNYRAKYIAPYHCRGEQNKLPKSVNVTIPPKARDRCEQSAGNRSRVQPQPYIPLWILVSFFFLLLFPFFFRFWATRIFSDFSILKGSSWFHSVGTRALQYESTKHPCFFCSLVAEQMVGIVGSNSEFICLVLQKYIF